MKKSISQRGQKHKQKVEVVVTEEFTGKNLTRFGGAGLIIRRFLKSHGIEKALEDRVKVEGRRESRYSVGRMFVSLLYGVFLSYSRPSHMEVLSTDRVFQKVAGLLGFPVQSTISRFLAGLKVAVVPKIGVCNFDLLMKFKSGFKGFKEITLDMDSHVIPVFGNQQRVGLGYNPKKSRYSYHPFLCFIGETRDYIGGFLRNGKHHTSHNAIPLINSIVKKLPSHIKEIKVRADSVFFSLNMLKFLIKKPIEFYVVLSMQPWVQKKIKYIKGWRSIGKGVEVSQCDYVLTESITITMVFIRQRVRNGEYPKKQLKLLHTEDVIYDYQVIVTNSDIPPKDVWKFYNQKACCENFILLKKAYTALVSIGLYPTTMEETMPTLNF